MVPVDSQAALASQSRGQFHAASQVDIAVDRTAFAGEATTGELAAPHGGATDEWFHGWRLASEADECKWYAKRPGPVHENSTLG